MTKIEPRNLTAQLQYYGRGNPPNTRPASAISNCFPGLEFDFRTVWRRMLIGIVLSENNNYVVACEDLRFKDLVGCRLVRIDGLPTGVKTTGTTLPGFPPGDLQTGSNPDAVSFMEWSNSFARVLGKQGETVPCVFTAQPSDAEVLPSNEDIKDTSKYRTVELQLRPFFEKSEIAGETHVAIARELLRPGELTQGLCSPWQNDYRECACYYWAASRPDYVNVQDTGSGETRGDNWVAKSDKARTGRYVLDDRSDSRLVSYDDLFRDWQGELRFIVGGTDTADQKDREA